jgi:1-deoxy-D-xylulose-5-phosphate reductoisomerase
MKNLAILGSTGSIGVSTLDIVAAHPDRFRVVSLSAGNNLDRLEEQIRRFRPRIVSVVQPEAARDLRQRLGSDAPEVVSGVEGLIACSTHGQVEMVLSAIVGAAGLVPTMAAIESGKDIALANKETLVTAGPLVMEAVARQGVKLYPVDSEHSAIFQSLEGHRRSDVRRLILTASGGPFRNRPLSELGRVTPEDALAHPNWSMGRKISIDSATMMNKGLEVIEACWLYAMPGNEVQVIIHPQSVVHSMVQYQDGSVLAQLGNPDMRTPIAHCLAWPERIEAGVEPLDMLAVGRLDFEAPDLERFPCLRLAQEAWRRGGTSSAILNAANEVAVQAFLDNQLAYTAIPGVIESTLEKLSPRPADSIDNILEDDARARDCAAALLAGPRGRRVYS